MDALFGKIYVLFIILLEMSYFRSARAFTFLLPQSLTKARHNQFSATSFGMQMNSERGTSVGSKFESWYLKTIKTLSMHEELIPIPLDSEGYDVFNFMALPRSHLAVPILGIDIVSLPRGSLAAIDFQPHDSDRAIFASEQYTRLKDTHEKYSSALPSGGDMQDETKRFFSPYAIWTRIPPDNQNDSSTSSTSSSSSSGGGDLMSTVGECVEEYVRAYSDLLLQHSTTSSKQSSGISEDFLAEYLTYRIEKDPAKRLLVGAFGNDWTQRVLQQVMFPTLPGTPQATSMDTPHTGAREGQEEGGGVVERSSSVSAAANVPSVITFVTGNAKKRKEVEEILLTYQTSFQLVAEKVDLPELQGEPVDIAIEKCRLAADTLRRPVITEDTSLCFHALKGLPGPYIKWFLEKLGHEGLNNLLLAYPDKSAYAQCVVAYCEGPGCEIKTFVGRTEGHIVPAAFLPPGPGPVVPVFGWDPIFKPLEFEGTYAQMPKDEKNKISHRYRAFAQLAAYLGGKAL